MINRRSILKLWLASAIPDKSSVKWQMHRHGYGIVHWTATHNDELIGSIDFASYRSPATKLRAFSVNVTSTKFFTTLKPAREWVEMNYFFVSI